MHSYLFYDLETSGLNKAFDQIVQFAAIRTDSRLNEIERHNFLIRLRPDTIISPWALITHRIPLSRAETGTCEYEAAKQIHRLLNEPGTISLGYNTLGFDDEFLRFTFHRNLLPPYTHQYYNGCRRMDIFPITIMFHLYRDHVLTWPERDEKISLKLEDLNAANRLATGMAHDALVDVEATLALARRFMQETEMWNYLAGNFVKEVDRQRMESLPVRVQADSQTHAWGIMVSSEFGKEMRFQAPVLAIGNSISYKNQTLWLRMDLPQLRETTPDTVSETTWVSRKRLGEPGILLPPHDRFTAVTGAERMAEVNANVDWIKSHPDIFAAIVSYHQSFRYPEIPDLEPDAALYQIGFPSRQTEALCREFHAAALTDKAALIDRLPAPETKILAERILARNYPESLSPKQDSRFAAYLSRINPSTADGAILDYRGEPRTTPVGAMEEIARMKAEEKLDPDQRVLLDELATYLKKTFLVQNSL